MCFFNYVPKLLHKANRLFSFRFVLISLILHVPQFYIQCKWPLKQYKIGVTLYNACGTQSNIFTGHTNTSVTNVPITTFTHLSLFCSGIPNMQCFICYLEITGAYLDQYKHSTEEANKWGFYYCRLPKHPRH
jgi:hypothetical protein